LNIEYGSKKQKLRNDALKHCNCVVSTGVAIGAGWQSIVAYVNIGCYYIIGIPVGVVLGNVLNLQVKVGILLILELHTCI